jgi:hypothetical protein
MRSGNFGLFFQTGNLPAKQVQFPLGYVAPKFLMMWQPRLEHSQYFSTQSAVGQQPDQVQAPFPLFRTNCIFGS